MKRLHILFCMCISISASCQLRSGLNHSTINIQTAPDNYQVNAIIWLPAKYDSSKKYPLIIYAHGSGQAGQDLNKLYNDGLPSVLKEGFVPPFDCVIICPQRISYSVQPEWMPGIIEDAIKRFSIDQTRIYLTGTSAGGYMCFGSQLNVSVMLARKIAAMCVISGATQDIKSENLDWWFRSKTHLWSIVGADDAAYVRQNIFLTNAINQLVPGIATISIRNGVGHNNWEEVYNGQFRENNLNIWEWLYQYKLGMSMNQPGKNNEKPGPKRIALTPKNGQVYCTDVRQYYNAQPGDTLVVPTGIKSFLLKNFNGEKNKPIVIIPNDSGWIGGYVNYSANISQASNFKMTGFHIDGERVTNFGLIVAGQTDDFEISNSYIRNCGSIGLCVKQDPDISQPKSHWPAFSIKNVSIHDITVHNTGTEGLYLGYTFDKIQPLASPIVNLRVYNIRIDSTGWDGLQLSNSQNVRLHDIVIKNYGLKNEKYQQSGLLVGGMVTIRDSVYNVNVTDGTGAGLIIFGRGLMKFTRITLKNVGTSHGENAIFVNDYQDLGYGLPPLEIRFNNIKINGSSGHALVVLNSNNTMRPGKIENFTFVNAAGIKDDIDTIVQQ